MDLDVLYEIDVPKPWNAPHPHGQRAAEQRAYREAVEQIRFADRVGFRTVNGASPPRAKPRAWGTSSTTSARTARTAPRPRSCSAISRP